MALSQRESALQAKLKIANKEMFRIGDIFSVNEKKYYVVYSYGYHYPMFVWDRLTDTWYENITKYSATTLRHKNLSRPSSTTMLERTTEQIQDMLRRNRNA